VRDASRAAETLEAVARHAHAPAVETVLLADLTDVRADVVVSTVPAEAQTAEVLAAVAGVPVVFDVVYDPWPTPLAAAWAARGGKVLGGLDLLVHQAVLQVELMTGKRPSVRTLRRAGTAALAAR